jgi:hypothetical protein
VLEPGQVVAGYDGSQEGVRQIRIDQSGDTSRISGLRTGETPNFLGLCPRFCPDRRCLRLDGPHLSGRPGLLQECPSGLPPNERYRQPVSTAFVPKKGSGRNLSESTVPFPGGSCVMITSSTRVMESIMTHARETDKSPNSCSQSHPDSASNSPPPQHDCSPPPQHDCGGDAYHASLVSVAVQGDLHPLSLSADLGAIAHVGDLLSAQVSVDIGHDCFHV